MSYQFNPKSICLILGIFAGIAISQIWPHETMQAATADRNENFAMITVPTGSNFGSVESVFVLDFLTGRLVGATMDPQTGRFTRFYVRNVGADFGVRPRTKPQYAISSGMMPFTAAGNNTTANGILYVSELTSGKVAAYGYPYSTSNKVLPPMPIGLLDVFPFREVSPVD